MNHEVINKVIRVSTVLACSIISALACEKAPVPNGTCGTGKTATCYYPTSRVCPVKESCVGGTTYFQCLETTLTTTCDEYSWTVTWRVNEYGVRVCTLSNPTFAGNVPATCKTVYASMGPGCI